jgi:hypothetical protein
VTEPHDRRLQAADPLAGVLSDDSAAVLAAGSPVIAHRLSAWTGIHGSGIGEEEAAAWLFGMAKGTLANHRRGQTRRHALADRLRAHLQHRLREAGPPADETVAIRDALTRLPADDRELLSLVAWDDLRTDEAAALLGITPAAARHGWFAPAAASAPSWTRPPGPPRTVARRRSRPRTPGPGPRPNGRPTVAI